MQEIIQLFSDSDFNWIGISAAFFGILYVILAAKENIWCWPSAAISAFLQMWIFYKCYPAQSALQIFYIMMTVYGYIMWNKTNTERIKEWSAKKHLIIISSGAILTFIIGVILTKYFNTSKQTPIDALTTVFSVFACYMVAKKVLENWLYWIIIDSLIVYLCYIQGEYFLLFQYLAYTIIAIFGYFSWIQRMKIDD